jgi:uncharacterized ferritin-like protein (DUF455 family)
LSTLWQAARDCLRANETEHKVALTRRAVEDWCNGYLSIDDTVPADDHCEAGLPAALQLVQPKQLPRRRPNSPEGRAALIHAVAHIEYNAINLAWDAVYRFRGLPRAFYNDWIKVAGEECYHFSMMASHLASLGHSYGDFPAHNGLWQMAKDTRHDPLVRMALVPRVLEARGLDVTPGMIERLQTAGDQRAVAILRIILRDEIGHVAIGGRWFNYLCKQRDQDPQDSYIRLYQQFFGGNPNSGMNTDARREAGFGERELAFLEGSNTG